MKVLVVGGGGREHALCWKLRQSPLLTELYCAPGNPGIAAVADCVAIAAEEIHSLADFALEAGIDLTIVGPELPRDVGQHAVEDRLLLLDVARPIGGVELIGPQFDGHEGMPGLQWRPLQRAVGADAERHRTDEQDRDQGGRRGH